MSKGCEDGRRDRRNCLSAPHFDTQTETKKKKSRDKQEKEHEGDIPISRNQTKGCDGYCTAEAADKQSVAPKDMLFVAKKTEASRHLPEPYLVYFLLADLLDFKDLGQWEN